MRCNITGRKFPWCLHEDLPSGGHINDWQTSDGKSFGDDYNAAKKHEDELDAAEEYRILEEAHYYELDCEIIE